MRPEQNHDDEPASSLRVFGVVALLALAGAIGAFVVSDMLEPETALQPATPAPDAGEQ